MKNWIKAILKQKFRVVPCGNGRYKIQERFMFMWQDDDDCFFDGKTYENKEKALRIARLKYAY